MGVFDFPSEPSSKHGSPNFLRRGFDLNSSSKPTRKSDGESRSLPAFFFICGGFLILPAALDLTAEVGNFVFLKAAFHQLHRLQGVTIGMKAIFLDLDGDLTQHD